MAGITQAWLAEALVTPTCRLVHLALSLAGVKALGAHALAAALRTPSCVLTSLELGYNDIDAHGARVFCTLLAEDARHCRLNYLDLSSNILLGDEGACALAALLEAPDAPRLEGLKLQGIGMSAEGARALALALRSPNCALRRLDVNNNDLGEEGAHLRVPAAGICPRS